MILRMRRWLLPSLVVLLVGCGHSHSHIYLISLNFNGGSLAIHGNDVIVDADGRKPARIAPDGSLTIGDQPVALTPAGRTALAGFHDRTLGFVDHAKRLGKGSARFALHTVGSVLRGLLHGDVEQKADEAQRGADRIKQRAAELCAELGAMRSAQQDAAGAVPEFVPYAVISQSDVDDCNVEGRPEPGSPEPASPETTA